MYDTHHDLLDALQAAPETFQALLAGVTQAQAQAARGGDEGWSVVEVVCHLRDAEERGLERARAMATKDDPVIAGYDQEAWARERNYAADDLRRAFSAFVAFRQQHLALLESLSREDWERTGQHTEMGIVTILTHTQHMAAHDAIHAAQIARQMGQAGK